MFAGRFWQWNGLRCTHQESAADYLEIDGVCFKCIATSPNDFAVAKSVCAIGHFMGKLVIAELVYDERTLEVLREIGVDFAHGYGVGTPQPRDALLLD